MILFYSGGSAIIETSIRNPPPSIMNSYYLSYPMKDGKPESRLRDLIAIRSGKPLPKRRKKKGKAKGANKGQ